MSILCKKYQFCYKALGVRFVIQEVWSRSILYSYTIATTDRRFYVISRGK
jgi:hypothetical protein